ncbi:hypothetical protein FB565_008559 [Actinoplanes lutulentus]|uniref:Uncharacterized protein n=1 Tax=Actinoplanes lutulentus TaxID=1287878 RepID=A0A327Z4F8_9ACTN|nr:hypothetical protein [Actinoplanes lutulentus]MBB2948773.1 hypothetical protein [Actinoplanes lutulentus]RAK29685.1 hypothetical protein B0I29_11711 [Actinoplanes lutulentus]
MVIGDAPVPGDVVFGWSPWRYVVAAAAMGFFGAVVGVLWWESMFLLFPPPAGRPGNLVIANAVRSVTIYTISFAIFSLLFSRTRPAWLRFGVDWVDLAAERRDVVVVPCAAVTSARVRWVWPVAMLDVVVGSADESRVMRLDRGGRRPLRKCKGDQLRFSMPIAGLRSSSADIRSELRRRGFGE